jgi:hypothetical protein
MSLYLMSLCWMSWRLGPELETCFYCSPIVCFRRLLLKSWVDWVSVSKRKRFEGKWPYPPSRWCPRVLPLLILYEEHVLFGLNQIYYWVLKCTTCYHYTNIIKSGLINLLKYIYNREGASLILSVAHDSWCLNPKLKFYRIYKYIVSDN